MKTYSVQIIRNGESHNMPFEFSGINTRAALESAIRFAKHYVKQGKHIRILCEQEIVWDSKKTI